MRNEGPRFISTFSASEHFNRIIFRLFVPTLDFEKVRSGKRDCGKQKVSSFERLFKRPTHSNRAQDGVHQARLSDNSEENVGEKMRGAPAGGGRSGEER